MADDDLVGQKIAILKELDRQLADIVRSIALTAQRNLIAASPVDTGWFWSNWLIYVGETPPGAPIGSRAAVDAGAALDGARKLAEYTSIELGIVTLENAVPYGQALNAGHSPQAPAGFVEAALEQAVSLVLSYGMDKLDEAISAAAGAGVL